MIAYKIDNCDSIENKVFLEKIKEELKTGKYVFEFGLECYNPRHINLKSSLLQEIKNINCQKICHLSLNNKLFNVKDKKHEDWLKEIKEEISVADKLGAHKKIMHATNKECKQYNAGYQIEVISKNSEFFLEDNIFIENTYEDIDFQERLLNRIDPLIGFVLDIGHVKVHSKVENEKWIELMKKEFDKGRQLHFHIHDNDGTYDQHKLLQFRPSQQSKFFIDLYKLFGTSSTFTFELHGEQELEHITNSMEAFEDHFKKMGIRY